LPELWVFRHGETDWNAEERFQGQLDIPLNARGREQAAQLAPKLAPRALQALLSSDLSRAHETATIVAQALGVPVYVDAGLREANLGGAQGLTRAEIEQRFGDEVTRRWRSWHVSDADVFYPGGETGIAVAERVFGAMENFLRAHPEIERFGVATHGGVIRRIMQRLAPDDGPVPIPNGVVYPLTWIPDRGWFVDPPPGE
jgi:probable phosphoglycerate mutase